MDEIKIDKHTIRKKGWKHSYECFRDYLRSQEEVEVKKDTSYLEWYENWKKENFNYKEKEGQ